MTDKLNELIYDAAKESQVRFRWFLLATTLLSSLMITHMYLEQFGTFKWQLKNWIKDDLLYIAKQKKAVECKKQVNEQLQIKQHTAEKGKSKNSNTQSQADIAKVKISATQHRSDTKNASISTEMEEGKKVEPVYFYGRLLKLEKEEDEVVQKLVMDMDCKEAEPELLKEGAQKVLAEYTADKIRVLRHYNEFHDYKLRSRSLPVLNLEMDANDYVPVLAILLAIMSAAVWLSVSSMAAAMEKLATFADGHHMIEALKYRMTFAFPDARGDISCVSNSLLFLAVWLPVGALAASFGLDCWSVLSNERVAWPDKELLTARWACMGVSLFCVYTFSRLSMQASGRLKKLAYPWPVTPVEQVTD